MKMGEILNIIVKLVLFCTTFFLFCSVSSAGVLEDFLGQKYIESAHELKFSGIYHPEKAEQTHQHIQGWVDIVGYEDMIYSNGMFYIQNGSNPIIEYGVWDRGLFWDNNLDWIHITNERVSTIENITTAEIDIHLLWHKSTLKSRTINGIPRPWIHKDYTNEYTTFTDIDIAPMYYPTTDIDNTSIEIIIYNNTINPKTSIKILNLSKSILFVNYSYNNESIVHHFGTATQEYTDKNCPYMNITLDDCWEDQGNLSQFNGHVIIPSMNFSIDNLTITLNSPYNYTEITNYTIYELKWYGLGDTFSPLFVVFILIMSVFIIGLYIQIRRLKWR